MPASTLDPVNAALRTSLSKNASENSLDSQLAGSTKKALLADIEFEPAGNYQNSVLDKLKSKYIVLKSSKTPQASKPDEGMGADETLKLAKYELYPLEAVQLGWNNYDWSVGSGMTNMGNTCYLNSTLQALFHVPALVNWLMSDKEHTGCQENGTVCIICAMKKTLQESQQRSMNTIRPLLIYNKLRLVCRNFIVGRQEDAHEFLRYLVEAMEKAFLHRFRNHAEFDAKIKETTPLNQILGGYLRSAVHCLECGHVSTTFQHFQDLLLDIRKAQTLDEALDGYFSREKLDDESYHCEACRKKVPATKQFSLERAPMVLCIQLKRFSVSNTKISKHIAFRQRLDLTKYTRQRPTVPLIYRLVALVTHMGPTVNCGHYTAVAQAPSGNYYQFDDSVVRPISHQGVFNTNAYIMLYELESPPFAQKTSNQSNKLKLQTVSTDTQKCGPSSKTSTNGIGLTSSKPYGPELPPNKSEKPNNVIVLTNGNSNSNTEVSDSGKKSPKSNKVISLPKTDANSTNPLKTFNRSAGSSKTLEPPSKKSPEPSATTPLTVTKLVPYEIDDSNSSDDVSKVVELSDSRVSTKAAVGEWKVTSSSDSLGEPSLSDSSWQQSSEHRGVVKELCKMSHAGYSAPVASWNGTRSHLDKEVSNEKREERKRTLSDDQDQGRAKHMKTHNLYKSNPGYNPIQEYHNAKNWSQNNGGGYYSKPFFNMNRHRRNFHKNFHHSKNFRFRQ